MKLPYLLLLSLLATPTLAQSPKWLWWTPPSHVSKVDRLGYEPKEIVAMGWKGWSSKDQDQGGDLGVDSTVIVYGWCLAARNNELLRKIEPSRRRKWEAIRHEVFYFGMACIGAENTLAGGGTYISHSPKSLYVDVEHLMGRLVQGSSYRYVSPDTHRRIYDRLVRIKTLKLRPEDLSGDVGGINLQEAHEYGRYAIHHFHNLHRLLLDVGKREKDQVLGLMWDWSVDYMEFRAKSPLQKHRGG